MLTGGASAVYGADAVAGVVNFIMDDTFTGFRIDGQASVFNHDQHTDSAIINANKGSGYPLPTGNVINGGTQDISAVVRRGVRRRPRPRQAYATYRSQDPVLESTRDYSVCTLGSDAFAICRSISANIIAAALRPPRRLVPPVQSCNRSAARQISRVANQFVPGTTPFNYAPYNYFQRPDERYTWALSRITRSARRSHPYPS